MANSWRQSVPFLLGVFFVAGCTGEEFCEQPGCLFSDREWELVESLANLGPPPPDPVNAKVGNPDAETLGERFFFDPTFSGPATHIDALGRNTSVGRAPKGAPAEVSCATCHDPARGGSDHTSVPNHVSVGAGIYDVNSMSVINSAHYTFKYWNGRYDSLVWQVMAVAESTFSMNGDRVAIARTIFDNKEEYRDLYEKVFSSELPFTWTATVQMACTDDRGLCKTTPDPTCNQNQAGCPLQHCTLDNGSCRPRFPLHGTPKRGPGACDAASENANNWNCLSDADKTAITTIYVNFSKAISAYEYTLNSGVSPFDCFVNNGPDSKFISDSAKRGAQLFVGKASCIECHSTPLFSDNRFHNIGVPQGGAGVPTEADCPAGDGTCDCINGKKCKPWGWFSGLITLQGAGSGPNQVGPHSPFSDNRIAEADLPAYYKREPTDAMKGAWRTPGLREIELTPPYMHNGFYGSLWDVIEHYNQGGTTEGAASNQLSKRVAPIGLNDRDILDLIEFLKTLTSLPPSENEQNNVSDEEKDAKACAAFLTRSGL